MSNDVAKWLIAGVFGLVAVLLWRAWQDKQASTQWPWVDGVILVCQAEQVSPDPHHELNHANWRLNLRYQYQVAGQTFTGDRLRAMAERFPTQADALVFEQQFKVGQRVKVFHDPAKPSSSVLIPG